MNTKINIPYLLIKTVSIILLAFLNMMAFSQTPLYVSKQTQQFNKYEGDFSKSTDKYEQGHVIISSNGPVLYEVNPTDLTIGTNDSKTWEGFIYGDVDNVPEPGNFVAARLTGDFEINYSLPTDLIGGGLTTVGGVRECDPDQCWYHSADAGTHQTVKETGSDYHDFNVFSIKVDIDPIVTSPIFPDTEVHVSATGYPEGGNYIWSNGKEGQAITYKVGDCSEAIFVIYEIEGVMYMDEDTIWVEDLPFGNGNLYEDKGINPQLNVNPKSWGKLNNKYLFEDYNQISYRDIVYTFDSDIDLGHGPFYPDLIKEPNVINGGPSPDFAWAIGLMLTDFWADNVGAFDKTRCKDLAIIKAYNGAGAHVGKGSFASQVAFQLFKDMLLTALPPAVKTAVETGMDVAELVNAITNDDWDAVKEKLLNKMFDHLKGKLDDAGFEIYGGSTDILKQALNGYIGSIKASIIAANENFVKSTSYGKYEYLYVGKWDKLNKTITLTVHIQCNCTIGKKGQLKVGMVRFNGTTNRSGSSASMSSYKVLSATCF